MIRKGMLMQWGRDGMSPSLHVGIAEQFQRVLGGHKRFKHQAALALMASRQGEQRALMNCKRTEHIML
eukprot:12926730-Prorocentrum_lima.AAC.1